MNVWKEPNVPSVEAPPLARDDRGDARPVRGHGGTGYAVSKLPKGSVGSAQLRKNAVRSKHIKAGSITTAKLAQSTLSALRAPVAAPAVAGGSNAAAAARARAPDRVGLRRQGGYRRQGELRRQGATLADRATLADKAAAADTAAVADHAKLADNASKLGGKSVAEFLTSDTIRWITPFTIDEGTREMVKVGSVHPDRPLHSERNDRRRRRSGPGRHHHLDDAGEVRVRRRRPARQSRPGRQHRDPPVRQHERWPPVAAASSRRPRTASRSAATAWSTSRARTCSPA